MLSAIPPLSPGGFDLSFPPSTSLKHASSSQKTFCSNQFGCVCSAGLFLQEAVASTAHLCPLEMSFFKWLAVPKSRVWLDELSSRSSCGRRSSCPLKATPRVNRNNNGFLDTPNRADLFRKAVGRRGAGGTGIPGAGAGGRNPEGKLPQNEPHS